MTKIISILISLVLMLSCKAQNNGTMRYFNENNYKDWSNDEKYLSSISEESKYLKNGNERVKIRFYNDRIVVTKSNVIHPITTIYTYYPSSKALKAMGKDFYQSPFGITKEYDEQGKLIKEINSDKPYKILIDDVVAKVKEKYNINLENREEKGSLNRYLSSQLNNQPIYEINLAIKDEPYKMKYFLIDGTTGDILYETEFYIKGGGKNPFSEYLKSLKK